MPKRTHDIIGGPSLAVWLAMVAVVTVAWAAIPDWHIPDGTGLPPPDGCYHEINVNLSNGRFVCRGTPADALIEGGVESSRCLGGRHRIAVDLGFHAAAPFYFFFG